MADVVIAVPVLMRPHRVAPLIESVAAATSPGSWRLVFVGSPGDEAEHEAVRVAGGELLVIDRPNGPGDYAAKIQAAFEATTEPWLLMGGDDVRFHPGWWEAAQRQMRPGVGVVGTMDLANRRVLEGNHSTHPLISREYVDRFGGTMDYGPGVVLCPEYGHQFVDDELIGTAMKRDAWVFAADSVVEHRHPDWGTAPNDHVYALGRSHYRNDRALFVCRVGLWR